MAKERSDIAQAAEDRGRIQVRVSDFEHGLRVFDGIELIRIKSKDYSLLIMEDYFPILGSLEGSIELVSENDLIALGRMRGFYVHRQNQFALLVRDRIDGGEKTEESE